MSLHLSDLGLWRNLAVVSGHLLGSRKIVWPVIILRCRVLLLQLHQDSSRSYKEVCAPVIERCYFLFNEIRPATCQQHDKRALKSSLLANASMSRWQQAIQRIINKRAQHQGLHWFSIVIIQHSNFTIDI